MYFRWLAFYNGYVLQNPSNECLKWCFLQTWALWKDCLIFLTFIRNNFWSSMIFIVLLFEVNVVWTNTKWFFDYQKSPFYWICDHKHKFSFHIRQDLKLNLYLYFQTQIQNECSTQAGMPATVQRWRTLKWPQFKQHQRVSLRLNWGFQNTTSQECRWDAFYKYCWIKPAVNSSPFRDTGVDAKFGK